MHVMDRLTTGGMENGVCKLLVGLDHDRFEQTLCTIFSGDEPEGLSDTRCLCLNQMPNRRAFLVPTLQRIFARERPDIVHSRNWGAIEATLGARLARVPAVVHSEHGRDLQSIVHQPWRKKLLRRFFYGWANELVCVSQELREHYCRELGLPAERFQVLSNGVDTDRFRPNGFIRAELRRSVGAQTDTVVVGTVGRLDAMKDHLTLFRAVELALNRDLDLRLLIVGEGKERPVLEAYLAGHPRLSARTWLVGNVRDVENWLNAFDVFVLPSLSEGMSNTLLEAMAVGLPAIATAVGGNTEVIENSHSGLLVEPQKPEKISELLMRLGADLALRCAIGKAARNRAEERFSLRSMVMRYEDLYRGLLKQETARWGAVSRA